MKNRITLYQSVFCLDFYEAWCFWFILFRNLWLSLVLGFLKWNSQTEPYHLPTFSSFKWCVSKYTLHAIFYLFFFLLLPVSLRIQISLRRFCFLSFEFGLRLCNLHEIVIFRNVLLRYQMFCLNPILTFEFLHLIYFGLNFQYDILLVPSQFFVGSFLLLNFVGHLTKILCSIIWIYSLNHVYSTGSRNR